ncbi:LuxR C-terminal-related transcriptional regulator [Nocardia thailandica]|uniref:LuxR C-terminal-related transcriptional regulator n=1 Tax=Nocardia thailandica TaxID=257275 RepID=UPI0002FE35F9|nr:LuxR C-terminal-related transcriptional regulator [Nocardia thailandica]
MTDARDADDLRGCLRHAARAGAAPLVFGGLVDGPAVVLTQFHGARTRAMHGLRVERANGLGGHALLHGRPCAVPDYRSAAGITHHYDGAVSGERLRSVAAVPVLVGGRPRAVLYAADRGAAPLGDRATAALAEAARALSTAITVREEVARRVADLTAAAAGVRPQQLRDVHAELREIAAASTDPALRERLHRVCARLAGDPEPGPVPRLSRRELDVLARVGLGATNRDVARDLGVGTETVKSYLRSAMTKLGSHTRYEAVTVARRHGLLP